MSYAPQSLLDVREYLRSRTGLSLASLGIVGDQAHTYGYHLGRDRLPADDYSRRTARDKAGLTNAAAALDIGNFGRLRELTAHLVRWARNGRLGDVREIIGPGSDGRAYRWDHLSGWSAVRRAAGDSHEWHTHISFYRDSEQRSKEPPFRAFFEGSSDGGDDMIGLSKGDSGQAVKGLQVILKRSGHDPGPVDGQYGPKTAAAVLSCRRSVGSKAKSGDSIGGHAWAQIHDALARRRATAAANNALREAKQLIASLAGVVEALPAPSSTPLPELVRLDLSGLPDELLVPVEPADDEDDT